MERSKIDAQTMLEIFQGLKRHEGYGLFMDWVNEMTRYHFSQLETDKDPTSLARNVGALMAYKTVRARIEYEISQCLKVLQEDKEAK